MAKKTLKEQAIDGIAKSIKELDNMSFYFEYLSNGKNKVNEARKLLYETLDENGYALTPQGKAIKK